MKINILSFLRKINFKSRSSVALSENRSHTPSLSTIEGGSGGLTRIWAEVERGNPPAQGDYVPNCLYPVDFSPIEEGKIPATMGRRDLIIVTQTCDLQNEPCVPFIGLCPIYSMEEMEKE